MTKIVITGANGLLGSNLCLIYSLDLKNVVYATGRKKPNIPNCLNFKLDVNEEKDFQIIEKIKPDLIIHCAALTNVEHCEEHPEEAELVNVIGTKNIAESAKKAGSYLIHISTDAVFDGEKNILSGGKKTEENYSSGKMYSIWEKYSETDLTRPINVYAQTKLNAEKEIQKMGKNSLYAIVRTNIYGWNRKNKESLAEWMLHKLESGEKLPAVQDVYFSPILVNNLAEALLELEQIKYQGIINLAGSESCSKLEFARKIADVFELDKALIEPIKFESLNFKAKRAKNMCLNTEKAQQLLKIKLLNVEEGLKEFKRLREKGYLELLRK